ncbi:MAG: hypothetical protein JWN70_5160 [Planctomycetaceae bacterium]|nr:hypothetical protein [Planctomycetaceae bacterium]
MGSDVTARGKFHEDRRPVITRFEISQPEVECFLHPRGEVVIVFRHVNQFLSA